jgi:hypothetical protein
MTRRVITKELQADEAPPALDEYKDKLLKYIPADVVAFYIPALGLIASLKQEQRPLWLWAAFVLGLILTVLWTLRETRMPGKPPAITQTAICAGAFVVWALALGGPFALYDWFTPVLGSLLLIFYTPVVAFINPRE